MGKFTNLKRMNINDLKVNDKIETEWEYSLACYTMKFIMTWETGATMVSYVSSDYIILSTDSIYLFLNSEELKLVEYE